MTELIIENKLKLVAEFHFFFHYDFRSKLFEDEFNELFREEVFIRNKNILEDLLFFFFCSNLVDICLKM